MKKISLKSQRKMQQDAARGRWYNLVKLRRVPEFAAWLADEDHAWLGQSPDVSEILRMHRDGTTIVVWYDGRRTICGRHVMALWHTFVGCGYDKRVKLNAEYHDPDARELYDWIEDKTDHADQWDAIPDEAYGQLCKLCGVDPAECEDLQDLLDKCLSEIEKEEAEAKKK